MSIFGLAFIAIFLISVLSQFGSRLAAKKSILWAAAGGFILISAIFPDSLHPITRFLGIEVVSNFVLAGLIMFLYVQLLDQTAEATSQNRAIRNLVSNLAAQTFLTNHRDAFESDGNKKKVMVILPCFNEEQAIEETITEIKNFQKADQNNLHILFCIVNDGSKDNTEAILQKKASNIYTSHQINLGVAGVLLTGFKISQQMGIDFVVQCDSDGQHPIEQIPSLVKHSIANNVDLLIGSRFTRHNAATKDSADQSTTLLRIWGISVIRKFLTMFGRPARIFDPTSGFRVYSKRACRALIEHMPDEYPEPESIAILSLCKLQIQEFPVKMMPRTKGISSISGIKTVRFMTKVITALVGLRIRSIFRNPSCKLEA